jgi:predicted  nucleic acid-binding Zn-ribbon protein
MSELLENRVVRLEVQIDNHEEDIKELRGSHMDLKKAMSSIEKNLAQIKYLAIGALAVVVAQTVGLDKAIRMIFGS